MTSVNLPKTEKEFSIQNNDYKVTFPNNGQFIGIEQLKVQLTGETYNTISQSTDNAGLLAKYTVDMIAFFSVCCPQLKKDLKVDSFSELDMMSSKKLLKVYIDEILPWMQEWLTAINANDDEDTAEA